MINERLPRDRDAGERCPDRSCADGLTHELMGYPHKPHDARNAGPLQALRRSRSAHARRLEEARRLRGARRRRSAWIAAGDRRRREGLRAARPRRRRLPDRPQVVVHEARRRQAALPLLQRRRVGAGHVQGSRDHALDAARPDRGVRDRRVRDRRRDVLHLHPRRVHRAASSGMEAALKEAYAAGILGTNAMGTGKTHRHLRAPGRRRLHLRRRNRADELASRGGAATRASSRRSRRWRACSASRRRSTTSRRWPRCRTS